MVTPNVHEVASALHEAKTLHDIETADGGCGRCADWSRCRAAGACVSSFGGILALMPGSPEHARKVAEREQIDAVREGDDFARFESGTRDHPYPT